MGAIDWGLAVELFVIAAILAMCLVSLRAASDKSDNNVFDRFGAWLAALVQKK